MFTQKMKLLCILDVWYQQSIRGCLLCTLALQTFTCGHFKFINARDFVKDMISGGGGGGGGGGDK